MTSRKISFPNSLKDFVNEQVNQRGCGTSTDYVRELIRKEQDRVQLWSLLLTGESSRLRNRQMTTISIACVGKSG
jgi:antitoxin ParD1/3/4